MHRFFLHSLASLALVVHGLPQQSALASINPADPNQADPITVPATEFTLPSLRTPEPFPKDIPLLPDACEYDQLTQDCFTALANNEEGAYIYFDKDNGCSADQQYKIKVGFWDAQKLLGYAARWPDQRSSHDFVSANYWLGSDWTTYSSRIKGNLGRASAFINNSDNKKNYITVTCQDPKGYCNRGPVEDKAIGGYAWNVDWSFWTYGHINMCNPYYTLTDIGGKMDDLDSWRKNGETDKLRDMRYYQTYGGLLAHEMMHLRSTYSPEPEIVDVYMKDGPNQQIVRAYGPRLVHQLAQGDANGSKKQRGGALSTVNADSYVMLINSIFWWDATQYFPGVPGEKEGSPPPGIDPPNLVVFPSISLGNSTNVTTDRIDSEFDAIFDTYLVSDGVDDAPAQDQNICHDIRSDCWVTSGTNVKGSAGQTESVPDYNLESVNALELSVRKFEGNSQTPQKALGYVDYCQNANIDE